MLLKVNILIFLLVIIITASLCWANQEPDWNKLVPIIIKIESNGNPNAVSEDGCIGLMQISPAVFIEYQKEQFKLLSKDAELISHWLLEDLFNPSINREIGTWYLKRIWFHYLPHYKLNQTIENLLIAYNFGIGNLVKYKQGKIKLPKETRDYISKYNKLVKGRIIK